MFRINSTQAIKISKGDDVRFPLFVNKGTVKEPIRYPFTACSTDITTNDEEFEITINQYVWETKLNKVAGTYLFTYDVSEWKLNGTVVTLADYGLTVTGTPVDKDWIQVVYTASDDCYVIFYVLHCLNKDANPILTKKFYSSGDIYTLKATDQQGTVTHNNTTVNSNKDMLLYLTTADTSFMAEGEYRYQIKAYVVDSTAQAGYSLNTVTNRHPFYVIDDDYSGEFVNR